ncbi:MAG: DNA-directed RNA polymerase subunit omega [Rickettsiales bacterium]|jgi:DNA-directed RNA polymerase omega subunit|nr:DNA-directed RNA polymerase subunit omega [Rickettsiales bacterium]
MEENISIEKCLGVVPNKFDLTVLAINRAKELILGASSELDGEEGRQRKCVNAALLEIERGAIDIDALREKVKEYIANNNLFLKDLKTKADDIDSASENGADGAADAEDENLANLDLEDDEELNMDEEEDDSDFDLSTADEYVEEDEEK